VFPSPDFDGVFRTHVDYVWRIARLLAGEAHADDIVQEVFLVARRRLAELDGDEVRGWLYVTTRNVARNMMRSQRRWLRRRTAAPAPEDDGRPLEDALADRDAARLLDRFLTTLPPKKREAFVLHDIEGLPGSEIAHAIGVPLPTVYSRVRSARTAFDRFRFRQQRELAR